MNDPAVVLLNRQWCDRVLSTLAVAVCKIHGIDFYALGPEQRKFVTHYRCEACKLQPLYFVDLGNIRRPKCGRCGFGINFIGGKYGKIRKTIAVQLHVVLSSQP